MHICICIYIYTYACICIYMYNIYIYIHVYMLRERDTSPVACLWCPIPRMVCHPRYSEILREATNLYGLIHARYISSPRGSLRMSKEPTGNSQQGIANRQYMDTINSNNIQCPYKYNIYQFVCYFSYFLVTPNPLSKLRPLKEHLPKF